MTVSRDKIDLRCKGRVPRGGRDYHNDPAAIAACNALLAANTAHQASIAIPADQINTLTPGDLPHAAERRGASEDHQRDAVIWGITAAQVAAGCGTFDDLHSEIAAEFRANTLDPDTSRSTWQSWSPPQASTPPFP
ncbi:hypothetical protein HII36_21790 [Nonomuraea sp. NN258]|uniref:hypothetical protein n=1 Tax=Nonomuraea antri TaxID=2730852 RepID=UPI0015683F2D|nr:hypothetical protein [Nonomuraea antri]NRQ34466.1 hypothetical protein [Nonomuraea antri]